MPRVLIAQRSAVPPADRGAFLARLRARREHYRRGGCRYWVFEEIDRPGAYLEFIEAADLATLRGAVEAAPDPAVESPRVYQEAELD